MMLYCDSRSRRLSEASKIMAASAPCPTIKWLLHHIKFIVNFADQMFQNILKSNKSQNGAEFVHDHGHPAVAGAQLGQQFVRRFALRHDEDFMQHAPQGRTRARTSLPRRAARDRATPTRCP